MRVHGCMRVYGCRLKAAGAVLVAKLVTGEMATGTQWWGGNTRTPWNIGAGASGSSAGPGAATAAGLVGFSVGSEVHAVLATTC